MELSVKDGKIPQLMIDGKVVDKATFLSKKASHDGSVRFAFSIPESVEIETKKTSRKKKEVKSEDTGEGDTGETFNESE